jgi:hypothetical protein
MSAVILEMPRTIQRAAKRRMNRVELEARHSWMMGNRSKWETEATDGAEYETNAMVARLKQMLYREMGWERPTMDRMRRDIAEGRQLIEKRNRVKQWLASLGINLASINDPEQALFAAFEKLG